VTDWLNWAVRWALVGRGVVWIALETLALADERRRVAAAAQSAEKARRRRQLRGELRTQPEYRDILFVALVDILKSAALDIAHGWRAWLVRLLILTACYYYEQRFLKHLELRWATQRLARLRTAEAKLVSLLNIVGSEATLTQPTHLVVTLYYFVSLRIRDIRAFLFLVRLPPPLPPPRPPPPPAEIELVDTGTQALV